jgi:hypothetical protein
MVLPYLKGLVIIKCGFFYLVCGSIVYSVFVVIIFVDLVKVLNTWNRVGQIHPKQPIHPALNAQNIPYIMVGQELYSHLAGYYNY